MSLTPTHRALVLGYGSLLATVAGFVNAVAILTLAFPVANVTGTTTQLGMDAANPWLFDGGLLALILIGFLMGAAAAGATLSPTKPHAGARHSAVMTVEAFLLVLAFTWSHYALSIFFAAVACGLQNGTTSSLRTMQLRTTHFTGTVTDLGLIIGRSRWHGVDSWRITVLSATVVTFMVGGIVGTVLGTEIGEAALLLPAVVCVVIAIAGLVYDRNLREAASSSEPQQPDPGEREDPDLRTSSSAMYRVG